MHAFDWKALENISCTGEKGLRREENMIFSMGYTNDKHSKTLGFPVFTHINLPGKCMFSAVNSREYADGYSENAIELKENKLFAMR